MVPPSRHSNPSPTAEAMFLRNEVAEKTKVMRKTKIWDLWVVLLMNSYQNACSYIKNKK
jgi:hypothetical protein